MSSSHFKKTNELFVKDVDLCKYPGSDTTHPANSRNQLTIGDLHGNALKLIFFLIYQNVLLINKNNYTKLSQIYFKDPNELTNKDLETFNNIINLAKVNSTGTIRLIGDDLADRGSNDYFTLKVLEKLSGSNISFEILLSNHSIEFLEAYEKKLTFAPTMLDNIYVISMNNLQYLIDKKLVSRSEIASIMGKCYIPNLKALSYTLSEDKSRITIFSHAALGLNTLQSLAKKFNVQYKDTSAAELANTIDQINLSFFKFAQGKKLHTLYTLDVMFTGYCEKRINAEQFPLEFLMWNRFYDDIDRPSIHKDYAIYFVHGHDPNGRTSNNIYNLDNRLGKSASCSSGEYTILYSQDHPAPKLSMPTASSLIEEKSSPSITFHFLDTFDQKEIKKEEKKDSKPTIQPASEVPIDTPTMPQFHFDENETKQSTFGLLDDKYIVSTTQSSTEKEIIIPLFHDVDENELAVTKSIAEKLLDEKKHINSTSIVTYTLFSPQNLASSCEFSNSATPKAF